MTRAVLPTPATPSYCAAMTVGTMVKRFAHVRFLVDCLWVQPLFTLSVPRDIFTTPALIWGRFVDSGNQVGRTGSDIQAAGPRRCQSQIVLLLLGCKAGLILIFTSSYLLIFSSSHLHIFTSSQLHILTPSHLLIFSSSHLHILPSCPLALFSHSFCAEQCQRGATKCNLFAQNEVRSSKTEVLGLNILSRNPFARNEVRSSKAKLKLRF